MHFSSKAYRGRRSAGNLRRLSGTSELVPFLFVEQNERRLRARARGAASATGQPRAVVSTLIAVALAYPFVVNARVSRVFCSTSCALALPVAGLALELRFTDITWRAPAMRSRRGSMLKSAPIFAGSS